MTDILTIVSTVLLTCIVSRGVNELFDLMKDKKSTSPGNRIKQRGKKQ